MIIITVILTCKAGAIHVMDGVEWRAVMSGNDFTLKELIGLKSIVLQCREDYPACHSDPEVTVILEKIREQIKALENEWIYERRVDWFISMR